MSEGPEITRRKKRTHKKTPPRVRIPPDLEAQLKALAASEGSSFNQLCVDFLAWALKTYLEKHARK